MASRRRMVSLALLLPLLAAGRPPLCAEVRALEGGSFQQRHLVGLREALARYRAIDESGGWPVVAAFRPGERGERVLTLRRRLAATGDLPKSAVSGEEADEALREGLRGFQSRHGLPADGLPNAETISALNVPVSTRLCQIQDGIARVQAFRQEAGRPFVLVNIPEERLYVHDGGGAVVMEMKVVVGRASNPTPALDSRIQRIVVNPDWTLPAGPALEQALSAARADPGYLDAHNIQVLKDAETEIDPGTVDWTAVSTATFPYRLRQRPGATNPLGRLEFLLPNRFNVYLHDTPEKELFAQRDRRKSLGCVRVEKALPLASYLLRDDPRWPPARLAAAIREGAGRTLWLKKPVDVHLVYWTAWIDRRGRLALRDGGDPAHATPPRKDDCE